MATVDTDAVLALFRIIASEFSATTDDTVSGWISVCLSRVSTDAFGTRTGEAIARLVAHELTMAARSADAASGGAAGAGAVTALRAGDLSVNYGGVNAALALTHEEAAYQQTSHGLAYLQIRDSRAATGPLLVL